MTDQVSGIETDDEEARFEHRRALEVEARLSEAEIQDRTPVYETVKWGFWSEMVSNHQRSW